ncbi:phytanoyl-CoA dioxygenase family protein [Streptomyces sp. NPDC058001]|uniref:phytanoyl-CoA dioxygenase family protein n=1 Tax=Streptomyces sp. NPDC058001 TaxID=3346300 RepID=UPI0036EB7846
MDFEEWALPEGRDRDELMDGVSKLQSFCAHEPRLAELARHPAILATVARFLDAEPVLLQDMALLKPPGGGREKPWHQDKAFFDIPLGTPVVGVWIALDEATIGNGCMHLLPGTHAEGPVVHFARRDFQICDTQVQTHRDTAVPLPPGGALFFDGLLHHGTPPNLTSTRRRAVQLHYVPGQNRADSAGRPAGGLRRGRQGRHLLSHVTRRPVFHRRLSSGPQCPCLAQCRLHGEAVQSLPVEFETSHSWQLLPLEPGFGSGQTCRRRLDRRQKAGVFEQLHRRTRLDRTCVDGSHVRAKGGSRDRHHPDSQPGRWHPARRRTARSTATEARVRPGRHGVRLKGREPRVAAPPHPAVDLRIGPPIRSLTSGEWIEARKYCPVIEQRSPRTIGMPVATVPLGRIR